ncbi:divalent-cation tolerance protein CutA [Pirellulaceae bacterium SH501]
METPSIIELVTTVSSSDEAESLARKAIEQRLAACVQIDGPIQSIYRWRGVVETATEFRLCLKALLDKQELLVAWVVANHPYEQPEILIRRVDAGRSYAEWVAHETAEA